MLERTSAAYRSDCFHKLTTIHTGSILGLCCRVWLKR